MVNQTETVSNPRNPRKKTKLGLVLKLVGVLVVLLAVVVILLPTILSLGVVRGVVVSNVNNAIPGSIQIDGLRVGWMSDARVRGFVLRDATGDQILSVDAIDADGGSILDLLKTRGKVMTLRVKGVDADVVVGEAGRMNLLDALVAPEEGVDAPDSGTTPEASKGQTSSESKPSDQTGSSLPATPLSLPPDLAVMLDLQQIDIRVTTPQSPDPVRLELEDAVFDARNQQDIFVKSKGTMTAGTGAVGRQAGDLLIEAQITDMIDSMGVVDPASADIQADLVIDNAPLALLALAGQDVGQIQTLVGASAATVSGHISGHASDLIATLSVTAGESLGATLAASFDGQAISLKQPAIMRWELSPEALASVSELVVDEAIVLQASIESLRVPLASSVPDLSNVGMTGAVFFDAMRMQVEGLGKVALDNARLEVNTPKLGDAATVSIKADPSINGKPGSLAMTAKVLTPLDRQNLKVQVEGGLTDTPAAAIADGVLSLDGLLTALLGSSQSLTLVATATPAPSKTERSDAFGDWLAEATISGGGQGWSLEMAAGLHEQMIDLSKMNASIQLTQALVDKLNERQWLGEAPLSLKQPVTVEASLSGGLPASGAFEAATLSGRVGVDRVWVNGIESLENTSLRDIELMLGEGRLDQKKSVSLDAVVQQFAKRGSIKASASGVVFDTTGKPKLNETSVTIQDVPVGLIERLANQPGQLKPWLGEAINSLQLALKPEQGGRSQAMFFVKTPLLEGGGAASIHQTPEFLRVQTDASQPINLKANISDASLRTLRRQAAKDSPLHRVVIESNTVAQIRVPDLSIEKLAGADGLHALKGQTQITVDNLLIKDENGERVDLESLAISAVSAGLIEGIQIEAVGKRRSVETPMLVIKGVATGLMPVGGDVASDDDTSAGNTKGVPGFSGTVTGHRLPMALADTLAGSDQLLPRLFGQAVDVSWRGAWPGKADVNVTSNAIQLVTQAHTDAYEQITLPEGLSLKFDLLNLGDNALLGELHPVFDMLRQTSVVLLDPIELALDKNTMLPIADASLQALALTGGLNLGRIKMETGDDLVNLLVDYATKHQSAISNEDLQNTLALVNQGLALAGEDPIQFGGALSNPGKGKRFKNSNAKMTRIPFTLKDGVFDTGQSWIDSRDVQVGFQGRTDLNTGQVDYKLGIPGKTLIGLSDDLFGKVLEPQRVYEFNLDGNAVNGFNIAADGFDAFLRSGLMQQLQAKLTEGGGLDLTKFGVKKKDSDLIGGLLGGLLGGSQPAPKQQVPEQVQSGERAPAPANMVPWKIPASG